MSEIANLTKEQETVCYNILTSLMPALDKKALLLFTAGTADCLNYQQVMDELMLTKAQVVVTPAFLTLAEADVLAQLRPRLITTASDLQQKLPQIDLAVIPVLTRNTLAKGALGLQDNLVTLALADCFMRGKTVLALKEYYHPHSARTKDCGLDHSDRYNQMLLHYEEIWRSFGAVMVERAEFAGCFTRLLYPDLAKQSLERDSDLLGRRGVLTAEDVNGCPAGMPIRLPKKTVITPLAQERLEGKRISVKFTD